MFIVKKATARVMAARYQAWYPVQGAAAARVRDVLKDIQPSLTFDFFREVLGILESHGIKRKARRHPELMRA